MVMKQRGNFARIVVEHRQTPLRSCLDLSKSKAMFYADDIHDLKHLQSPTGQHYIVVFSFVSSETTSIGSLVNHCFTIENDGAVIILFIRIILSWSEVKA